MGRLKTAEGLVDYAAPQIAGREEPFRSEIRESLKGRTQALEDLAVEMLARRRALAGHPGQRAQAASDARRQRGARPGIRGPERPR